MAFRPSIALSREATLSALDSIYRLVIPDVKLHVTDHAVVWNDKLAAKFVYITLFVLVWIVLAKEPFGIAVAWSQNVAVVPLIDFVERVAHDNYGINLGKGVQEMVKGVVVALYVLPCIRASIACDGYALLNSRTVKIIHSIFVFKHLLKLERIIVGRAKLKKLVFILDTAVNMEDSIRTNTIDMLQRWGVIKGNERSSVR